jgi:hypothetical protein
VPTIFDSPRGRAAPTGTFRRPSTEVTPWPATTGRPLRSRNRGWVDRGADYAAVPHNRRVTTTPIRAVLADDDVLLREGLAGLLERSGFHVVGQADNASELMDLLREHRPELAISRDAAARSGQGRRSMISAVVLGADEVGGLARESLADLLHRRERLLLLSEVRREELRDLVFAHRFG